MKKLLCLLGGAMLLFNAYAQVSTKRMLIDAPLPDTSFGKMIYYKDSTANRFDFPKKLILFDFWFPKCSFCIDMFPKMDSLQRMFDKHLQVIMVTRFSKEEVVPVIKKWEKQYHRKWRLPIVIEDTILHQLFPHRVEPHYVWIAPENRYVAETSAFLITKEIIGEYLKVIPSEIIRSGYSLDSLYNK